MKKLLLKIELDNQSIECLKKMKGKKLSKVGYVANFNYSLATALIFEDFAIKVSREEVWWEEEEHSKLQFREVAYRRQYRLYHRK